MWDMKQRQSNADPPDRLADWQTIVREPLASHPFCPTEPDWQGNTFWLYRPPITFIFSPTRLQRPEWAWKGEEHALPGPSQPRRLHQRSPVRLPRPVQRHPPPAAPAAEHHLADDRASPVCEAVRCGQDRQLAAGDAAGRYEPCWERTAKVFFPKPLQGVMSGLLSISRGCMVERTWSWEEGGEGLGWIVAWTLVLLTAVQPPSSFFRAYLTQDQFYRNGYTLWCFTWLTGKLPNWCSLQEDNTLFVSKMQKL